MQKMFRHLKGFGPIAISVALIAALLVGSVVPAKAQPDRVVKIGLGTFYTGPAASVGTAYCNGFFDYVRYINEQGGINGINLKIVWRETRFLWPEIILTYRRLKPEGIVMYCSTASETGATLVPLAKKDGIPLNFVDAFHPDALSKPNQWMVCSFPAFATAFAMVTKWIKENLWTEARPMRVGFIFYDVAVARRALDATKYFDKIGAEFVGYEVVPVTCIDSSIELLRLAKKKPDWVYMHAFGMATTAIVKDTARLELQQKGIGFVAGPNSLDECALAVVGKDANGWYVANITPCYFETEMFPGLKTVAEIAQRYRGTRPEDLKGFYTGGWAHAALGVEAIRLAVEKVGYEDLTGRAVRDALFGGDIKDFDTGVIPPITITEETPYATKTFGMYEIREARYHPIARVEPLPSIYIAPEEFERALGR